MNIKHIYIYIFTAEVQRIKLGQCFPSARLNDWGCSTELLKVFLLETFGTTFWVFSIPRSKRKALCLFKAQVAFPALRFWTLKFASQTTTLFFPISFSHAFRLEKRYGVSWNQTGKLLLQRHSLAKTRATLSTCLWKEDPRCLTETGPCRIKAKTAWRSPTFQAGSKETSLCLPNCILW